MGKSSVGIVGRTHINQISVGIVVGSVLTVGGKGTLLRCVGVVIKVHTKWVAERDSNEGE